MHVLNKHFCDSIHEISARFNFDGIRKKKKELSYNEWKKDLEGAGFGRRFYKSHITSEADEVAERIRDVIASYAPDVFVRRAALQEKDLSLKRLINIAANFEAMANAPTLSNLNPIKEDNEVFRIENATNRRRGRFNTERKFDGARTSEEHFARCCTIRRNQKRNVNKVNYESDVDGISNVYVITGNKIARILVRLNGVAIEMQFDTGAAGSIIPMLVWKAIGSPRLVQTNKLRVYDGGRIEVMGKCTLIVEYGECKRTLDDVVSGSTDKPLFELPWALNFGLQVPADIIDVP
ncbi:hypothetical protein GJ496_008355 [Pomphorhynchus laevis]|nr:hypothetical protein GJ496_008355 [Pomphorhynchus laevis]